MTVIPLNRQRSISLANATIQQRTEEARQQRVAKQVEKDLKGKSPDEYEIEYNKLDSGTKQYFYTPSQYRSEVKKQETAIIAQVEQQENLNLTKAQDKVKSYQQQLEQARKGTDYNLQDRLIEYINYWNDAKQHLRSGSTFSSVSNWVYQNVRQQEKIAKFKNLEAEALANLQKTAFTVIEYDKNNNPIKQEFFSKDFKQKTASIDLRGSQPFKDVQIEGQEVKFDFGKKEELWTQELPSNTITGNAERKSFINRVKSNLKSNIRSVKIGRTTKAQNLVLGKLGYQTKSATVGEVSDFTKSKLGGTKKQVKRIIGYIPEKEKELYTFLNQDPSKTGTVNRYSPLGVILTEKGIDFSKVSAENYKKIITDQKRYTLDEANKMYNKIGEKWNNKIKNGFFIGTDKEFKEYNKEVENVELYLDKYEERGAKGVASNLYYDFVQMIPNTRSQLVMRGAELYGMIRVFGGISKKYPALASTLERGFLIYSLYGAGTGIVRKDYESSVKSGVVATLAYIGLRRGKKARKLNEITKMPKEFKIKLDVVSINKLKKQIIKKPEITKILDKKYIKTKDFLTISELSPKSAITLGTIEGQGITGSIVLEADGSFTTIINKTLKGFKPKKYTIIVNRKGQKIVQKIIDSKGNIIYEKVIQPEGLKIGIGEAKKLYVQKGKELSNLDEYSVRKDLKEIYSSRDVYQLNNPQRGEHKLTKGAGSQKTTIAEKQVFAPYEFGVLTKYGEELIGLKRTKILRGQLVIPPNKKMIEKLLINEELLNKYGKTEGIKPIGKYSLSTKGKKDVKVINKAEYELEFEEVPSKLREFLLKLRKIDYSKQFYNKKGSTSFEPRLWIGKESVTVPVTKINLKHLNIKTKLNIRLPEHVTLNGLESLITSGVITWEGVRDSIKQKGGIKMKEELASIGRLSNMEKSEYLTRQKNKLKQQVKLKQIQRTSLTQKTGEPVPNQTLKAPIIEIGVPVPTPKLYTPFFPPIPNKKKKKKKRTDIGDTRDEFRLSRQTDPFYRTTGVAKYSPDLLKQMKERYGNIFT